MGNELVQILPAEAPQASAELKRAPHSPRVALDSAALPSSSPEKTFFIETFGCQMNVHDSERLAGLLERDGYQAAAEVSDADVVILNTCSVREHAAEKLFSRLGELRSAAGADGGRPVIAVAGCVAQQEGQALLRRAPYVDVIVGTQAAKQLPALVTRALASGQAQIDLRVSEDVSFPLGIARRSDPVKAYVTILEGCNDRCAFCVVPSTRGHERTRPQSEILAEVAEAVATGRREIQLLGQIVNHYQAPDDPACDFPALLEAVDAVPGVERIRFASPHPRHASDRLIAALRDLPRVCKHIHLPLQSGSTRVLQAMRRRHTREDYLRLVDALRAAVPDIAISTDMIVGFPGETVEDFEATLSLVEVVRFNSMFSFKYSPRPNTMASRRMPDDVSEEEKGRRLAELMDLQRTVQLGINQAAVGLVCDVLIDSVSRRRANEVAGRTTGNTVVNLPGPREWLGRTIPVRIVRAGPNSLRGEPVEVRD
jgi:tRNA-2-methylthio-N6-dimethylallyladenosine synthase